MTCIGTDQCWCSKCVAKLLKANDAYLQEWLKRPMREETGAQMSPPSKLHGPGSATYYINQLQSEPSEAAMQEAMDCIGDKHGRFTDEVIAHNIIRALDRCAAAERERAEKIAEQWLHDFGERNVQFVSPKTWARGAVLDIVAAIRGTQ